MEVLTSNSIPSTSIMKGSGKIPHYSSVNGSPSSSIRSFKSHSRAHSTDSVKFKVNLYENLLQSLRPESESATASTKSLSGGSYTSIQGGDTSSNVSSRKSSKVLVLPTASTPLLDTDRGDGAASPKEGSFVSGKVHWIAFVLGSLSIFLLWYFFGSAFPWFIYPIGLFISAMLVRFFVQRSKLPDVTPEERSKNWVLLHTCISLIVNVLAFISWIFAYQQFNYPWFIYPLFILSLFVALHYFYVYHPNSYPLLPYIFTYCIISTMLIITWRLDSSSLSITSWFMWAIGGWTLIFIGCLVVRSIIIRLRSKELILPPIGGFISREMQQQQQHQDDESEQVVVKVDMPPPAYEITPVHPQPYSSFPTLGKGVTGLPNYKSVPVYFYQNQHEPIQELGGPRKHQTSHF